MKVTGTTKAWVSNPEWFDKSLLDCKDEQTLVKSLAYSSGEMGSAGWIKVGTATIEVEVDDLDSIIGNQVEMLKAKKERVIAEAQAMATKIEQQIQELLCIEYKEAA